MSEKLHIPPEIDLAAFISKEAHDLKSPFNRAIGFIKLVLDGFDGPIVEQVQEDLTVAHKNSQHTLTMMNALVDIARLERGESEPILEPHSVNFILQQTIPEWTRKYHKKNPVEISISAPEIQIQADEIMIRHCFANWISYVNEFVQEAVSIQIRVEERPDAHLFTIRSSGSKRSEPPECDLTLYGFVARGILELHQGVLLQLEEDDQGALVRFSLPKSD